MIPIDARVPRPRGLRRRLQEIMITEGGDRWHVSQHCHGLRGRRHGIQRREPCSYCVVPGRHEPYIWDREG